jgi:hypothetical protein
VALFRRRLASGTDREREFGDGVVSACNRNAIGMVPELAIIVPVLNEADNIEPFVDELSKSLTDYNWEVVFVDDKSNDGTRVAIERLAAALFEWRFANMQVANYLFEEGTAVAGCGLLGGLIGAVWNYSVSSTPVWKRK